ncbi:hypothetical protein EDD15DRAFT_2471062 [Pisolithus albus]|nr:hypothetical protein EDD15DRAFT_2471062 [Pisolithus albus]
MRMGANKGRVYVFGKANGMFQLEVGRSYSAISKSHQLRGFKLQKCAAVAIAPLPTGYPNQGDAADKVWGHEQSVAKAWFVFFVEAMGDATAAVDLLVDDGFWRDVLTLTWDFHTYEGKDTIKHFLANQLPKFLSLENVYGCRLCGHEHELNASCIELMFMLNLGDARHTGPSPSSTSITITWVPCKGVVTTKLAKAGYLHQYDRAPSLIVLVRREPVGDRNGSMEMPNLWEQSLAMETCFAGSRNRFLLLNSEVGNVVFKVDLELPALTKFPEYEDLGWIPAFFEFGTIVGHASGIFRLVPLADGSWKAHTVYTSLESLKGFPEKTEFPRNHEMNCGTCSERREQEFVEEEPTVIVIGGGHSGLILAARLKMLGVNAAVVERNERIGDNWRKRWNDESPMIVTKIACKVRPPPLLSKEAPVLVSLRFPPSWPVFTPGLKLADWLGSYARSLGLNVWTSATVVAVQPSANRGRWTVTVVREGAGERRFEVNHVVFATGLFGGAPKVPNIPHQCKLEGTDIWPKDAFKDYSGKKVTVIGSGPSEVTMVQRGSVYVVSAKNGISKFLGGVAILTDCSLRQLIFLRDLHDSRGCAKSGLSSILGKMMRMCSGWSGRGQGEFVSKGVADFGASQKIIDGDIGLKSDSSIARYTPAGLLFEDGSTLDTDVIVFATGYTDARDNVLKLLPTHLHESVQPIWGLDKEGELNSVGRELGGRGPDGKKLSGLWTIMGNVSLSGIYSKFIALQIDVASGRLLLLRFGCT